MLVGERDIRNGNAREGVAIALSRLRRDDRGMTMVLVAIVASALIGFTGLAVETGLWYTIQRYNQPAADAAAVSGVMEKAAGRVYSDICSLAKVAAADANNFVVDASWSCPTSSPTSQSTCTSLSSGQMCVNNPPLFGSASITSDVNAVEVILAQQQSTLFSLVSLPGVTS